MFFTDQQKSIYEAPDGRKFDPLRVLHGLTVTSGNRLHVLVAAVNGPVGIERADGTTLQGGDVSASGRNNVEIDRANAEMELADIARKVFVYPPFMVDDAPPDAVVLETLYHFLGWIEGKDSQAPTPRSSDTSAPAV